MVAGALALIAYLSGRKSSRNLWLKAELARKQYKAEAAAIDRAHADKSKKVKKAEKEFKNKMEKIEKIKSRDGSSLEAEKRRAQMRIAKDQDKLDKSLKDMGIDEV